jgi:hypothetical protein
MSAILFEEHRLILSAAAAFLNALREPQRQPSKIHQLRASLGSQMMRHRTTENDHVMGPFMAARGFEQLPDVLGHAQTIQQEWLAYSEHVRKWTPQAIEADWDGYAADVECRVNVLRKLTPYEEREVYVPILRFLGQRATAACADAPVPTPTL